MPIAQDFSFPSNINDGGDNDDDGDAGPQGDDVQKGGESGSGAENETNAKGNADSNDDDAGNDDEDDDDKEGNDEEEADEDEECQVPDMSFINLNILVQGESSDADEDLDHIPLASEKRKGEDTTSTALVPFSQSDDSAPSSPPLKKSRRIISLKEYAKEWGMSVAEVKEILDDTNKAQHLRNIAKADEALIQNKLQAMGTFEAHIQKFLEFEAKSKSAPASASSLKPHAESALDKIDRQRFQDVFSRRVSQDRIIKVRAPKPRGEKILTLMITRQGPKGSYSEVVQRDALVRLGYTEWLELLDLANKQTSALSSELSCALHLLINKVKCLDLVPKEQPQCLPSTSACPRVRRTRF